MFVKMSDGKFIPQAEMGDNNVYDYGGAGRGRRSRSWENCTYGSDTQKPSFTAEELTNQVKGWTEEKINKWKEHMASRRDDVTEEEIRKHLGYYVGTAVGSAGTQGTSARMLLNFTQTGIRNAVTWGELETHDIRMYIAYWEKVDEKNSIHRRELVTTEKEYQEKYQELKEKGHHLYVGFTRSPEELYEMLAKTRKRKAVRHEVGYVVRFDYKGYGKNFCLKKGLKTKLWLAVSFGDKYVFATEAAADKALKSLERFPDSYNSRIVKVERDKDNGKWRLAV